MYNNNIIIIIIIMYNNIWLLPAGASLTVELGTTVAVRLININVLLI